MTTLQDIQSFSLRQLVAAIFLLAFFMQTFNNSLIVADYFTNTAAFAKNCENKARPAMHCNGKCQMMKKLKEEEKKDQQNTERKSTNKNEVILASKTPDLVLANEAIVDSSTYSNLTANKPVKMPRYAFHPPGKNDLPLNS